MEDCRAVSVETGQAHVLFLNSVIAAPDEQMRPWAEYYWFVQHKNAKEITHELQKHYDHDRYHLR
jgi:hypothetical protein